MPFGLPNVSYIGFPAPALVAGHAGLGLREARPGDIPAILAHFARMSPECRRRRFCATISAESLERHVRGAWDRAALTLVARDGPLWDGVFHKAGPIRAMAELGVAGAEAEIGLSVDADLRRRGVATYLIQTAAWLLAPRGVTRITAYATGDNTGMTRLGLALDGRIDRSGGEVEIAFDVAALRAAYLRRRVKDQVFRRVG